MPLCVLLLMGITSFTLFGVVGFSLIRPNQREKTLTSIITGVNELTYRYWLHGAGIGPCTVP
jgi:hypothetical protein